MNYTSSINTYLGFSFPNLTRDAPVNLYNFKERNPSVPKTDVIHRLNIPFEPNYGFSPVFFIDYLIQTNDKFTLLLNDALQRYKDLNNGALFDITIVEIFINKLKNICDTMQLQPYIMFNKFATKIQLNFNNKEFVLDYDHEELDTVYILSSKDGTIFVKECTLDKLEETIRTF